MQHQKEESQTHLKRRILRVAIIQSTSFVKQTPKYSAVESFNSFSFFLFGQAEAKTVLFRAMS